MISLWMTCLLSCILWSADTQKERHVIKISISENASFFKRKRREQKTWDYGRLKVNLSGIRTCDSSSLMYHMMLHKKMQIVSELHIEVLKWKYEKSQSIWYKRRHIRWQSWRRWGRKMSSWVSRIRDPFYDSIDEKKGCEVTAHKKASLLWLCN